MTKIISHRVGYRSCPPETADWDVSQVPRSTQGEIEAAICEGVSRFQRDYMGRGPRDIRAQLIDDLIMVRLQGVLTVPEHHLARSLPVEKGRDLLKQMRSHLIETGEPKLKAMIQEIACARVLSLHHDISTVTGEEILLFTLAEAPRFRETNKEADRGYSRLGRRQEI